MRPDAPIETERKFLVRMPSIDALRAAASHTESEIEQIYLNAPKGQTHRLRRRTTDGITVLTQTRKQRLNALQCIEDEREITEDTYRTLLTERDADRRTICKVRHTFVYKNQMFEVDIYPFWQRQCVVETELEQPDITPDFPPFLDVLREVSGDRAYSNAALSKHIPSEDEDSERTE